MCLITHQMEPLIAKKDIPVYKIIRIDNSAPFMSEYKYKHGSNKARGFKDVHRDNFDIYNIVNGGFLHAYSTKHGALGSWFRESMKPKVKIVKMYIPACAEYYLEKINDEICATELLWISPFERLVRWFKNN